MYCITGVEDFVPEMVRYVAAGKPVFEKMSELLQRANRWISQHKVGYKEIYLLIFVPFTYVIFK